MAQSHQILFFEPRIEGHHLHWLCLICQILIDSGYQLSIALDDRTPEARNRINDRNPSILNKSTIINAFDNNGNLHGGTKIHAAAHCLSLSNADEIFFNSLDEFTSSSFRKAVFGIYPPSLLKGKLSGIYHRPRPLDDSQRGLSNAFKRFGFNKLKKQGWFKHLFLLDEYLFQNLTKNDPEQTLYYFLPDPWMGTYTLSKTEARTQLGIPQDKLVLLHYGTASKRKGMSLLLKAFQNPIINGKYFLLVAGNLGKKAKELPFLQQLEASGHAKVLNYYVSDLEEKTCFCAADFLALPYINHYGSSGILSHAAAAKLPVIASDYHLLGKRVKEHNLGILFENNNPQSLQSQLIYLATLSNETLSIFKQNLEEFSKTCSFQAFQKALKHTYPSQPH